ncbi:hypothetical protein C0Q70_12615 [Pomacea canaliculata]|uniref:VWFA domain-containing protein n=1 Tax=Pomacea canaliculata TaxID=400727 RepID=A0A2T7P203_POMCA|nr:hypothetical protein C0Q70_12615 [Pomacea canaliculata]
MAIRGSAFFILVWRDKEDKRQRDLIGQQVSRGYQKPWVINAIKRPCPKKVSVSREWSAGPNSQTMLLASGSWLIVTSLLLTLHATPGGAQGVDKTREANQGGADVVDAVVDVIRSNCIFSEDRLFLRRLAYVESRDGSPLIHTYRPGYDGGIWQVDEDKFNATLACGSVLATYCATIRQPPSTSSGGVSRGQTCANHFTPDWRPLSTCCRSWEAVHPPCLVTSSSPMDLAFILDSSGSITDASFNLSLDFAARVVEAMNIPDPVRVAALIFASSPFLQFNFSDTQTTAQVAAALRGIKRSTGSTATYLALDMARTSLFTAGSRSSANRVVVLVTDGESDNRNWTEVAANMLKSTDQGGGHATVFAVGVGGYNPVELMAMATEPKCLHVFTLDDFSVISSIIYEIQRSTCTGNNE